MTRDRQYFPGEWNDLPPENKRGRPYFGFTGALKPPLPVHPHTSFGRSVCNGKCRCGVATSHVSGVVGTVLLEWAAVEDGAYVLELSEHRTPMAVPHDPQHHDGWARYRLHVCNDCRETTEGAR
jgi:hypothetical protein